MKTILFLQEMISIKIFTKIKTGECNGKNKTIKMLMIKKGCGTISSKIFESSLSLTLQLIWHVWLWSMGTTEYQKL